MKKIIILIVLNVFSCNEKDFYGYNKVADLWRIPIIEPYEIVSTMGDSSDDWFLELKGFNPFFDKPPKSVGSLFYDMSNVDKVAVHKWHILVHSSGTLNHKGVSPCWIIIDLKTDAKSFVCDKETFEEKIQKLSLEGFKEHGIKELRKNFFDFNKLPEDWYQYHSTDETFSDWSHAGPTSGE